MRTTNKWAGVGREASPPALPRCGFPDPACRRLSLRSTPRIASVTVPQTSTSVSSAPATSRRARACGTNPSVRHRRQRRHANADGVEREDDERLCSSRARLLPRVMPVF
ncbi:hypothetical protein MTO96_001246 [Rhipicephalus appendiculatus]